MRAFTITGPGSGEIRDVRVIDPGPGEALVQVGMAGICGTDYHLFAGDLPIAYPTVTGHEFSGTVAALGSEVGDWRVGDRVAVDPTLYCGHCYHCLRRQANHCDNWGAIGDSIPGGLAEFVTVPARNLYRVEDHEALDDATFTEPLACVVWGVERLRVRPSDRALVFGAGPMGLLMTQMLVRSPVADVVVVDTKPAKLEVARDLGAGQVFAPSSYLEGQLVDASNGRKFDIVIDCTGVPSVIESMFRFAGANARILLFGVAPPAARIDISPFEVFKHDWEILGSQAINYTFQQARDLLAAGRILTRPLISRVARLEDVPGILGRPKLDDELKTLIDLGLPPSYQPM
jgi:2-desacetyl-2-hydroxyethyl bacteriochlorophyllide A dehydrogenase